jgi:hypothetical protein
MDGLSGATNNMDALTELERVVPRRAPHWAIQKKKGRKAKQKKRVRRSSEFRRK